jgi:hypothetical protein
VPGSSGVVGVRFYQQQDFAQDLGHHVIISLCENRSKQA